MEKYSIKYYTICGSYIIIHLLYYLYCVIWNDEFLSIG